MLTKEQVKKIASLARLELSEKEVEKFQKEFSTILDYFNKLQEVDISDTKPTSQVTELINIKRSDDVNYNYERKEMLSSAIEKEEDHLKVKNVF